MTLNAAQLLAVSSTAALRVVIAGPGSGKTRTMVEAVKSVYLEPPNDTRISVMTFTNAGANEFRTRLGPIKLAHCGTLHSYAFKIIQRFGGFLGYIPGKVGILPEAERIPRLLQCRDKLGLKKLSQKHLLDVATWPAEMAALDQAALVWKEYEFLLKRNNLVDYDGILRVALELLGMSEVRCQIKLDYLFVDEYQDSALIDQTIYANIPARNKMLVGDPDQSIFAFRGAHPAGLINATNDFEVHKLELIYRSDSMICVAANRLISHNKERVEKLIIPVSTEPGSVEVREFEDVAQELAWIATTASGHHNEPWNETVAVLYRMNHDVKVCRDYLIAMGLPVQVPKYEQRPANWERAMLLLALLRTPENQIIAERFFKLTYAAADVDRWSLEAQSKGRSLIQEMKPAGFGSWQYPDGPLRILAENGVGESTLRMIQQRAELLSPDAGLDDLLHDLHSGEETKASNEAEGVYVGTIHSAKGREFDVVFLPAFEQGILPHGVATAFSEMGREPVSRQLKAYGDLEEERRLAFVAVTRAKHELYISHCAHRRGPWGPVGLGQPSQFIREMGL